MFSFDEIKNADIEIAEAMQDEWTDSRAIWSLLHLKI